MGTVEVFKFTTVTNLNSNPIERFSPQTIMKDTPDQLYVDVSAMNGNAPVNGMILLPYLDAKQGPIYDGKQVVVVVINTGNTGVLQIQRMNQDGSFAGNPVTLNAAGQTMSITAFWDENSMVGQWLLNRLA